eukprot:3756191-Amphidinium_carterae.1
MHLFRQAIAIEVDKRLVVKKGRKSTSEAPILMKIALNGDWRVSSCIERRIAEDAPIPQRETIVWSVQSAVLASLTDAQPTLYPRHRWVGGEEAIADLGILMPETHGSAQLAAPHISNLLAPLEIMDNTNLAAEEPTTYSTC